MCLIERFTDVYPQETRTRKITRRCLFSPRAGTCRRTRVWDHGNVYHIRRVQLEDPVRMAQASPKYHPAEPARPRERSTPAIERLKRRSQSFKFYIPFLKGTYKHENDQDTQRRKEGERAPRPFIVDPPKTRRHAHPRIDTISPQRGRAPSSDCRRQYIPGNYASPSRNPQDQQPRREPRGPRQRTPVNEREPLRRTQSYPPRIVEIHNHRTEKDEPSRAGSRARSEERRPQSRRVRFSRDIECEQINDRAARNEGNDNRGQGGAEGLLNRRNSFGDNSGREYELFEVRPNRRHHLQERVPSPWPGRQRRTQRSGTTPNITHIRPRIIQEGHRQMSRAGERVCMESRGRPGHERIVYDRDHRRYGGHWR